MHPLNPGQLAYVGNLDPLTARGVELIKRASARNRTLPTLEARRSTSTNVHRKAEPKPEGDPPDVDASWAHRYPVQNSVRPVGIVQ